MMRGCSKRFAGSTYQYRRTASTAEMLFRFSGVHLAKAVPGRQSSGVCVADVQFAAVVLATHPTPRIQSANHGSCLGSAAADDDRDPDFLSEFCGPAGSA